MIFSDDRATLRKMYVDAWQKRRDGLPMSALEAQIADIVELHPEYQGMLEADAVEQDYAPEGGQSNPFLHMGLHLGLREQIATNRPAGIRALFERIAARRGDAHDAEHQMIECLAETLWQAQAENRPPDEAAYIQKLRQLAG